MHLLERIQQAQSGGEFDLEAAVAAQVSRLAATHDWELPPGLAQELGLGLPAVTDLGRDGITRLEEYAARLERVIRRHEPRLEQVHVLVRPGGPFAAPGLVLEASLADADGPRPFQFLLPR